MRCGNCKEWGRTVTLQECLHPVACPVCERLTWPNLGVNCPVGCAVALAAAAAMESEAVATGNAELLAEAEDILTQPIEAPVVVVQKAVPKVQGVTYRDQWKAHPEIDVKALAAAVAAGTAPTTFLTPNLTAINQFGRATQGAQPVSGIRWFNDRQIAARG